MAAQQLIDEAPVSTATSIEHWAWHGAIGTHQGGTTVLEQMLGAVAYGVGALLDPFAWLMAGIVAWCSLPRWWLVAVLGVIPGPTMLMLGLQLATVPGRAPSAAQWLGVALISVLVTLLVAALLRAVRKSAR